MLKYSYEFFGGKTHKWTLDTSVIVAANVGSCHYLRETSCMVEVKCHQCGNIVNLTEIEKSSHEEKTRTDIRCPFCNHKLVSTDMPLSATPSTVFHYCSMDTFYAIITNKTLRLSDITKSNDSMEILWVTKFIKEAV